MAAEPALLTVAPSAPLLLFANGGAGRGEGGRRADSLRAMARESGRDCELVDPARHGGMPAALETVRAAAARGVVPVAVGGDGTINALAGIVLDAGWPIGVVPCGTFNYFARALGVPLEPEAAMQALLRARPREVTIGWVNRRPFLVNASVGLYPQLLEDRESFLRQAGRNRVLAVIASLWLVLRHHRQLMLSADATAPTRTPTLFVGNNRVQLERLGLDDALLAALDAQRLVGLKLRPVGTLQLLALILRGALGRLGDADRLERFAFATLSVQPPRRRRVKVALDGEVHCMTTPLVIEPAARPLRVLLP